MAARPGYAQPDPRNPFANPPMPHPQPHQYQQGRRDYDAESDFSDPYGSRNGSTAHLASHSHYDDSGQYDSPCEYRSPCSPYSCLLSTPLECIVLSPCTGSSFSFTLLTDLRIGSLVLLQSSFASQRLLDRTYILS